jgi:hypothetical protein
MKYIKRYNEESDPATYRRASTKLNTFDSDRAGKMWDTVDKKEFGVYNMHIYSDFGSVNYEYNISVSSPKVDFYFGSSDYKILKEEEGKNFAELLVDRWFEGDTDKLSVTFAFSFIPNYKSSLRRSTKSFSDLKPEDEEIISPKHIRTFEIQLDLCDEKKVKEYRDVHQHEMEYITKQDMYEYCKKNSLYLKSPVNEYGIFSDRKSAFEFWKKLPELIKFSGIMDILLLVGGDENDISDIKELFSKIRVNLLHDSKMTEQEFKNYRMGGKWFGKNLVEIEPSYK